MRIFIDKHYFISSIITTNNQYSCQVMMLVNGMGMTNSDITENQKNVVSCIVCEGFTETNKICNNLQEIADFQLQCLLDLCKCSKSYSAPETMVTNSQEDEDLSKWEVFPKSDFAQ